MSKKDENRDEQPTGALEEAPADKEGTAEAVPGADPAADGESMSGSKNFKIIAAGVTAAIVAGALFLAPGDRLLGIESSSAGIERHHEEDGGDHHDFEDEGAQADYDDGDGSDEDYEGKGQTPQGSSRSAPYGQDQLGTSQS